MQHKSKISDLQNPDLFQRKAQNSVFFITIFPYYFFFVKAVVVMEILSVTFFPFAKYRIFINKTMKKLVFFMKRTIKTQILREIDRISSEN